MNRSLSDLARVLEGELIGDNVAITGCAGYDHAHAGDLTFAENVKRLEQADASAAAAVLTNAGALRLTKPIIRVSNPRLAFSRALELFNRPLPRPSGIHPSVVIGAGSTIGADVAIGPNVVIGAGCRIGSNVTVHANSFIGDETSIGDGTILYPNVTVFHRVSVGRRCLFHSGVVVGADGFGFVQADDRHLKIPQIGTVEIGDDVELGANTTVDRATTGATRVGSGSKIDNLVQIAHNVQVGRNCVIVAQCGIAGSTVLEDGVVLAGQVGIKDHIHVGKGTIIGAQSGVMTDIPDGAVYWGTPARPQRQMLTTVAHLFRLHEYADQLKELRARLEELEKRGDE